MIIKRLLEETLKENLKLFGAIVITGPKFCGKTFLASLLAKSTFIFEDISSIEFYKVNKEYVLSGPYPKLIDEWQICPRVWDNVRVKIDSLAGQDNSGLFILTGSSSPLQSNEVFHTGVGRIDILNLTTLTFAEILNLDATNSISLMDLFDNKEINLSISNQFSFSQLIDYLINGGWPVIFDKKLNNAKHIRKNYIESVINLEAIKETSLKVSPNTFRKIMKSMARRVGTQKSLNSAYKDLGQSISKITFDKYIQVMYDSQMFFDVSVWGNENIRSSYKVLTKPKIYMCDTSLICEILEVHSETDFINDMNTLGFIFENQVMKDLSTYVQVLDGKLYYYRDENGNEVDAIIELPDGRWGAIEIKLSFESALDAVEKLDKTIKTMKINSKRNSEPTFKCIICNGNSIGKKNDTYIIPHTLIRP